jgi:hypothetical protein
MAEVAAMEKLEIGELAVKAFQERYPEDTEVRATEVVREAFGGALAVIRSKEKTGNLNEELIYVYPDKTVRVFTTTEEQAAFLEQKARQPLFVEVLSNSAFISGIVFLFLIVATFVAGFFGTNFSKDAFAALTGILGTAAGFYFGSRKL